MTCFVIIDLELNNGNTSGTSSEHKWYCLDGFVNFHEKPNWGKFKRLKFNIYQWNNTIFMGWLLIWLVCLGSVIVSAKNKRLDF